MKKCFLHSTLAVLGGLLFAQCLCAGQYYKPVTNRLGVWTELGVDAWLAKNSELKNSVGGGLGIGFGYELQREHFLFDVGIGINALYNPVNVKDNDCVLYDQFDWDPLYGGGTGEKVDYHYCMVDRQDKYLNLNIQIPIMVGFTVNRFFMLAGFKAGYLINVQTFCDATVDTKGYNNVIGMMQNMPMYQYYNNRKMSNKMRCTLKPDLALSFEMGGYLGEIIKGTGYNRFRSKKHLRLSIFADYGLTQINQSSSTEPMTMAPAYVPPSQYDMIDAASLKDAVSSNIAGKINNLFVGIKFTAFFDLPEPRECVLCKSDLKFVPRKVKK